jgi:putative DNA primase/helicase
LGEPDEVKQATDAYRAEQDAVGLFIAACCIVSPEVKAKRTALFEAYQTWSGDRGTTSKDFGTRLEAKGYAGKVGTGNAVFHHGIALREGPE